MSVRKMHRDIKANKQKLYVLEAELFELQQRTKHNKDTRNRMKMDGLMLDKVTPKYDLSWYVKWCSSLLVLTGMLLTAVDIYPYNLIFHLFGVMGWCIVGLLWHDRALILLNGIATFIFALGLLRHYMGIVI